MAPSKGMPKSQPPGKPANKIRVSHVPSATGGIIVPKRRSSLRNARSGNSLHDALETCPETEKVETSSGLLTPPLTPATSLDEAVEKFKELTISKNRPKAIDISSVKNAPFTPPKDPPGISTPEASASKALLPFSLRKHKSNLITPPTRRTLSSGLVVDKSPASTDRFIPSRPRENRSTVNFRTNKPMSELTPEQRQMRFDGTVPDPFMARRVTPQLNIRRSTSSGRYSQPRSISAGGVWNVGGGATHHGPIAGIHVGGGVVLGSGTNARMFSSNFYDQETAKESHDRFEGRLAMALDLDRCGRVLDFSCSAAIEQGPSAPQGTEWRDMQWKSTKMNGGAIQRLRKPSPAIPVLDAPSLKDDFYCSLLAYCPAAHCLAVALKNRVYLWSEDSGVVPVARPDVNQSDCYITSLSFSCPGAGRSILAIGRSDGRVNLWQIKEPTDRIQHCLQKPVACLAFKPVSTRKFSDRLNTAISAEEILVGDEVGTIFYYSVEWPTIETTRRGTALFLVAKICLHKQQVCGLIWSPDGEFFASGGNDNVCFLMCIKDVLERKVRKERCPLQPKVHFQSMSPYAPAFVPNQSAHYTMGGSFDSCKSDSVGSGLLSRQANTIPPLPLLVGPDRARHCWQHAAAIKAIAFCPWQQGLIATGGGSNDRAIHFFHTRSGACLATIDVHAQVTSLIWSTTRKEICATFSYAQPDHPYRIAVFSWPECQQVVRIAWHGNIRALYAIPYPGRPNEESEASRANRKGKTRARTREGRTWYSRTKEEGCIVVAGSDESIKFHEIWAGSSQGMGLTCGGLAWSSILESEEGGDVQFRDMGIIR